MTALISLLLRFAGATVLLIPFAVQAQAPSKSPWSFTFDGNLELQDPDGRVISDSDYDTAGLFGATFEFNF